MATQYSKIEAKVISPQLRNALETIDRVGDYLGWQVVVRDIEETPECKKARVDVYKSFTLGPGDQEICGVLEVSCSGGRIHLNTVETPLHGYCLEKFSQVVTRELHRP